MFGVFPLFYLSAWNRPCDLSLMFVYLMGVWPCIVDDMKRVKSARCSTVVLLNLMNRSTCFGHYYAHRQEPATIQKAPARGTSPWLWEVAGLVHGCRFERPVGGKSCSIKPLCSIELVLLSSWYLCLVWCVLYVVFSTYFKFFPFFFVLFEFFSLFFAADINMLCSVIQWLYSVAIRYWLRTGLVCCEPYP